MSFLKQELSNNNLNYLFKKFPSLFQIYNFLKLSHLFDYQLIISMHLEATVDTLSSSD